MGGTYNTNKPRIISRRDFIIGAGAALGTAAIGTSLLAAACNPTTTDTTVVTRVKYVCPYDGKTFDSFTELSKYIGENFPGQQPISRFTSPYDGMEFGSLSELKTHLDSLFGGCIRLNVNNSDYILKVEDNWSLAFTLREKLGLTGTKIGCERGACGACTVVVDGTPLYACLMLAVEAADKQILTIEGMSDGVVLHPIQQAFIDNDAAQCGYCTPGFIMSVKALLANNPKPTRDEIREALSGHLCICGHTKKIVDAVLLAADRAK